MPNASEAMSEPILFGAAYSVYVRIARLALAEKGVACRLVEIDIFADGGPPADYAARQPFGRIPAFEHDGFRLYETGAITRYIDEAFAGPLLMPTAAKDRARANQVMSIVDNYAYPAMVWGVFVEAVRAPVQGRTGDPGKIAEALGKSQTCLDALEAIAEPGDGALLGGSISLADLYMAPVMRYFTMAPEGAALLARRPRLAGWWGWMKDRPSMAATRSPME
jgi:glutathione S-transferase